MSKTTQTSQFQQALEAVEVLSLEDQAMLLDILQNRLRQQRRNELLKEVAEVRQEYAEGDVKFGLTADFMVDLDESEEKVHG
ncbi:hypothetical protein QUB60_02080 [Microcoleus sp. A2-C5]|uniref:hypothetical protein n=1 Tax=Microcoleaceae TaxID=1892252 RepID=UPI002238111A|nr:hypothetical protein [Lyngbya sp. CCAP 1446/10]MCW6051553.1 hypothetical protein [Lyngbya sp. CCAP 1446/10]